MSLYYRIHEAAGEHYFVWEGSYPDLTQAKAALASEIKRDLSLLKNLRVVEYDPKGAVRTGGWVSAETLFRGE